MTRYELSDLAGRHARNGVNFLAEGITRLVNNPGDHLSQGAAYLAVGLATFVALSLTGHRGTRQGPTVAAAMILAWPIAWVGVFLHATWTALTYFLWQMWRGD